MTPVLSPASNYSSTEAARKSKSSWRLASGTRHRLDDDMAELAGWDSLYVIVGSAAGALIGLQFVVMTLVA